MQCGTCALAFITTTGLFAGCTANDWYRTENRGSEQGLVSTRNRLAYAEETTQHSGSARQPATDDEARRVIERWPEVSKKAATTMIDKYGPPQGVTPVMLVWKDNGPWVWTIVMRDPIPHHFPIAHEDVLEQFIHYRVPTDKFDELAAYDGSVVCERTAGWMSARCDKEEMNFLALNLAHAIVAEGMSVEQARQEYAKTAMAAKNGEKPDLIQGLRFRTQSGGTADPDTPVKP